MLKIVETVSRRVVSVNKAKAKVCTQLQFAACTTVTSHNYTTQVRPAAIDPPAEEKMSFQNGNGHAPSLLVGPCASLRKPLNLPEKLLMGPGPTNQSVRVLKACAMQMGHMHAETFKAMDEIKEGMRYLFQTNNPWTVVISGPGHLGMEAIFVNLLEPGETVVIGLNGIWGGRAIDLAKRLGVNPVAMEQETGKSFSIEMIEEHLKTHRPKVLFLVHSESSTGVMQPLKGVGDLCRKYDCLLAVDTVASLGGVPFFMDEWNIDAVYTGSQKVIGAPPGLAPISFGSRAVEKIKNRQTPIKSYLLDMTQLTIQWQCGDPAIPRIYHHTPPVNLFFGLREALAEITEEGLENLWKRHAEASQRLNQGLVELGLKRFVENPEDRLPTVTTISIPEGVDWKRVTQYAMEKYKIEIAGGLGPTVGKVFRIGVLGINANPQKVDETLRVLKEALEAGKISGRL